MVVGKNSSFMGQGPSLGQMGSWVEVEGPSGRLACKMDADGDKGENRRPEVRETCPWQKRKRTAWSGRPVSEGTEGRDNLKVGGMSCGGQGPLWAGARRACKGLSPEQMRQMGVELGGQAWRARGSGFLESTMAEVEWLDADQGLNAGLVWREGT